MAYDIYIGEADIEVPRPEDNTPFLGVTVRRIELPEAPEFAGDHFTRKSNYRNPGYSTWEWFCRETGLLDVFFDPTERQGLMDRHPGSALIRQEHLDRVRTALDRWRTNHPNSIAGFDAEDEPDTRDGILARLIWLEFWMAWALANCKVPTFHNQ